MWIAFIIAIIITICIFFLFSNPKADTVIYGSIFTGTDGTSTREALATKNDKIIYVGDKDGASAYIGDDTQVLDYGNYTVMPGITDGHTHINMATEAAAYWVDVSAGSTVQEYLAILRQYIEAHPDNNIYMGMGWNYNLFDTSGPTANLLDTLPTDKPIYLKSQDSHSAWVNSKMIETAGVTASSQDPDGGKIERYADGRPSGCFRDTAMGVYLKSHLPVHTVPEYKELIKKSQTEYASMGYTAYVDVFIDTDDMNYNLYQAYEELDRAGELALRVNAAWLVNNNDQSEDLIDQIIKWAADAKGGMFEVTDIKFFMDGVVESGTAYLSEPYANDPTNYGNDRWVGDEGFNKLVNCIDLAHRGGLAAHFHAMGDAAVTKALDAIEASKKHYNNPNLRDAITHLELVKESDKSRFKELNVVAVADLVWGVKMPGSYKEVEVDRLGETRAEQAYPYRSLADAGATVSFATDYPPGSIESPFIGFHVATSRALFGLDDTVRDSAEAFSRVDTLKIFTAGGAYQMNQEKIRGTLEVSKKADITVADVNFLTTPNNQISLGEILLTMVDGKTIYQQ